MYKTNIKATHQTKHMMAQMSSQSEEALSLFEQHKFCLIRTYFVFYFHFFFTYVPTVKPMFKCVANTEDKG